MNFNNKDFSYQDKIELLQRWILVHSYLYYIMDTSLVSDSMYDGNSTQLYDLKVSHPTDWSRSRYTYAMDDFNGSTGFGYVEQLNEKEWTSVTRDVGVLVTRNVLRRNS